MGRHRANALVKGTQSTRADSGTDSLLLDKSNRSTSRSQRNRLSSKVCAFSQQLSFLPSPPHVFPIFCRLPLNGSISGIHRVCVVSRGGGAEVSSSLQTAGGMWLSQPCVIFMNISGPRGFDVFTYLESGSRLPVECTSAGQSVP